MSNPSNEVPDEPLADLALVLGQAASWIVPPLLILVGFLPLIAGGGGSDETLVCWIFGLFGALLLYFRLGGRP